MNLALPVAIAVVLLVAAALVIVVLTGKKKDKKGKPGKRKPAQAKDRASILKETNRRLASNPKDPEALKALGDLHYREQSWDKAMSVYATLADLCGSGSDLDEFEINARYGLSAMKAQKPEDAYKALLIAHSLNQENFEVNFNLGLLEYQRKAYEKALPLLKTALSQNSESAIALRYYGHVLFKLKNFKDAIGVLRKAIDIEPEDKESLFTIAETYFELGQAENALKVFSHLRTDPLLGPNAALFAGTIHINQRQFAKAAMDFEIGLKHPNMKVETLVELKYRLAAAYLKQQEISRAVSILNEIQNTFPAYKDVPTLIDRYQELNANRNLQVYLIAPASDFVTLCRKLVACFFPGAKIKITDIAVIRNEYADVLADVETKKWSDIILFRFIRSTGVVGELNLRDLYARIKDLKAGKGYCMTAGSFSEEARRFVEARLIDLVEKPSLIRTLNGINSISVPPPDQNGNL